MRLLALLLLATSLNAAEVARLRYERMEGSAVVTGHGTAFCIAENQLLTAAHNILDEHGNPRETIKLEIDGTWIKAVVIRHDADLDIALLKCKAEFRPLLLAQADAGRGAVLTLIGSKRGETLTIHSGKVIRPFDAGSAKTRMKVSDFARGESGGPVLLDNKVIGIVISSDVKKGDADPDVCLFMPLSAIREFLKQ
jgi:hypothetical protein